VLLCLTQKRIGKKMNNDPSIVCAPTMDNMASLEAISDCSINTLYLSLVIPLFNEEENVNILYDEIKLSLDALNKPYEILFVDDRSTDDTFKRLVKIIIEKKEKENPLECIKIIRFNQNYGQTAAMQAGFDFAMGQIIVSMDGDLQNDPKDIPRLLEKMNEGYDVVCGWRKRRKDKKITRIIPSKIANWIIGKITGVNIHDNGCSLKAFKKETIKSVRLYSDLHRFIPALTTLAGARITEIVVNHRPRKYGATKYGLSRTWKVMSDILTVKMLIHFSDKPIVWFASLGAVFGILGVVLAGVSLFSLSNDSQTTVIPAASLLFLTLFGNFISWGIIAEYIVKITGKRSDECEEKKPEKHS
jgi:glycosyltransferase involved in cell wall biosynthesis